MVDKREWMDGIWSRSHGEEGKIGGLWTMDGRWKEGKDGQG